MRAKIVKRRIQDDRPSDPSLGRRHRVAKRKSLERLCAVISPRGEPDSPQRLQSNWLFDSVIHPVVAEFSELRLERADIDSDPSDPRIDHDTKQRCLLDADLILADLGYFHPNTWFEIGVRLMTGRPIIHFISANNLTPMEMHFNYIVQQFVSYSTTSNPDRASKPGFSNPREELREYIKLFLAKRLAVPRISKVSSSRKIVTPAAHIDNSRNKELAARINDVAQAIEELRINSMRPQYRAYP
jgi:hypothetical protein